MGQSDSTRQLVDGLGLFSLGLGAAQLLAPGAMNRLVRVNDHATEPGGDALARWGREFAAGVGIESRRRPHLWLWARVVGDMFDRGMLGAVLASPGRGPIRRNRFMAHLQSVEPLGGGRSRWRASVPAGA